MNSLHICRSCGKTNESFTTVSHCCIEVGDDRLDNPIVQKGEDVRCSKCNRIIPVGFRVAKAVTLLRGNVVSGECLSHGG